MFTKKILLASLFVVGSFTALPALSADLVCTLNVQSGGNVFGNGTSHCEGIDFSFGNSTSGSWAITNITKSIDRINWIKGCNSGLSCTVTVRAYAPNQAEAYIHYDDGTIEYVEASMHYETGF
ncbi:hypothetical protein ACL7TT_08405 [Microbulbifer sp. 2304DJ12-6]|uniref:hypothetical protein n=1 Tax=Microbulbifer sp. 2304DJ12-6 TaxID=3233340 RepID=UPI0026073892|nr:hypothetical protein [uncultured Microbulbifer sp.]